MGKDVVIGGLVLACVAIAEAQQVDPRVLEQLGTIEKAIAAIRALGAPTPPNVILVPPGGDVQAALDTVPDGGTVQLAAGATYTVNLVFKKRGGPVTLRGLSDSELPPLQRVTPTAGARMPKLVCRDCLQPTIAAAFGASGIRIVALEVLGNKVIDRTTIAFNLDASSNFAPTLADQPSDVILDRLYIHADAGGHMGVRLDGRNMTLVNSDVRGFLEAGRDSQAVGISQGAGPFFIVNNYLEGSGENVMVGGNDPVIQGLIPSDITFTDNTVFKPLAWKATRGSVKNLFELKNAQRVRVERNTFDNNWVDAQPGSAIVITVRNQDGRCPWCVVRDVTFANNVVRNAPDGYAINILGKDDNNASGIAERIVIINNLFLGVSRGLQVIAPLNGLGVTHNTFVGVRGQFLGFSAVTAGATVTSLNVRDNVTAGGAYGITGDGSTGVGVPSLSAMAPGAIFTKNLIERTAERTIPWPAGQYLVAPGALANLLDARSAVLDPMFAASDGGIVGVDVAKLPR